MLKHLCCLCALFAMLLFNGCATRTPAPVADRRPPPMASGPQNPTTSANASATKPAVDAANKGLERSNTHSVQKGETLYSIAFQHNVDYRELAIWNNIENLNVIKIGEVLRLTPPNAFATVTSQQRNAEPVVTPLPVASLPSAATERPPANSATLKTEPRAGKIPYSDQTLARLESEPATVLQLPSPPTLATLPNAAPNAANDNVDWAWPVKANVISAFTELNKGIDLAGMRGTAVHAAATGTVIHTGAGIRGYGRLVIIKHGISWVSAYAHNEKIVVTEGQQVKQGQKIAEMGNSDADQVKLHFEIRKQGKPVDPIKLLPVK